MKTFKELNESLEPLLCEMNWSRLNTHMNERNTGLISASRGEHTEEENKASRARLEHDIKKAGFGYKAVRGRYIENADSKDKDKPPRKVDEHSFLVLAKKKGDDSGELKGFLKSHGEKYKQDSIIHRQHGTHGDSTAVVHHTDGSGESYPIGDWHPNMKLPIGHTIINKTKKEEKQKAFSFKEEFNVRDNKTLLELSIYHPRIGISFFGRKEKPEQLLETLYQSE